MLRLEARLWKSRWLAITAMLVILLVVFLVPLALFVGTIVSNADEIVVEFRSLLAFRMPAPPAWLVALPMVGPRLGSLWHDTAAAGAEGLWARLAPYAGSFTAWLVARAGGVGYLSVQYLLTLILAGFITPTARKPASPPSASAAASAARMAKTSSTSPGRRRGRSRSASASRRSCSRCSAASAWPSPACLSRCYSRPCSSCSASRRSACSWR